MLWHVGKVPKTVRCALATVRLAARNSLDIAELWPAAGVAPQNSWACGCPTGRALCRATDPVWEVAVRMPSGERVVLGALLGDDKEFLSGIRVILRVRTGPHGRRRVGDGAKVPVLVSRLRPDVVRMRAVDGIRATEHLVTTLDASPKIIA